jgi:hypothetical protein
VETKNNDQKPAGFMGSKLFQSSSFIGWFSMVFVLLFATGGMIYAETTKTGDLRILKSEITSMAKFYPYTGDGVKMEVMAVKATDGTIRTAFNTCQVCYDSGRGFYTQQGDELVCNNCGNRFKVDKIEKVKFGCNPIPITSENKRDDGQYITISKSFLVKYTSYFKNWKR